MGTCAQIHEISLGIEGDLRVLRKVFDQLHFVRLILFLHESDGFFSWKGIALDLGAFFDDLLHFLFQGVQLFPGKGFVIKIIVKSCVNGGTDGELCLGIQVFHRFCQHMGSRVAKGSQTFLIIGCQDV